MVRSFLFDRVRLQIRLVGRSGGGKPQVHADLIGTGEGCRSNASVPPALRSVAQQTSRPADISAFIGMDEHFCDPASPWQRGSNETPGPLRSAPIPVGPVDNSASTSFPNDRGTGWFLGESIGPSMTRSLIENYYIELW